MLEKAVTNIINDFLDVQIITKRCGVRGYIF